MTRPVATAAQCRAARAFLGWTQTRLAGIAGVARKTVADFENGNRQLHRRTRLCITAVFEQAGVVFTWPDQDQGEGVSLRPATALDGQTSAVAEQTSQREAQDVFQSAPTS